MLEEMVVEMFNLWTIYVKHLQVAGQSRDRSKPLGWDPVYRTYQEISALQKKILEACKEAQAPDYWLTKIEEGEYETVEGHSSLGGVVDDPTPLLHRSKMVAASEGEPVPVYVGKRPAPELGDVVGYGIRHSDGTIWLNLMGEKPIEGETPFAGRVVRIYAVDEED